MAAAVATRAASDVAPVATVDLLYVAPDGRRRGVASALFDDLERWAAAQGCTRVETPALPGDRALKSFCEARGLRARLLLLSAPIDPRR